MYSELCLPLRNTRPIANKHRPTVNWAFQAGCFHYVGSPEHGPSCLAKPGIVISAFKFFAFRTAEFGETLPLPCISTALAAKTLHFRCCICGQDSAFGLRLHKAMVAETVD